MQGATLLREVGVYVRHRRRNAEEAHGSPLERSVLAVIRNGRRPNQWAIGI
ncbi:hypothetical protein [Peribacillus muralis]|uniref:hypothetical protein n=1 Tax=Peribacillus muralis TaxID=264697 RepID=UPI00366EFA1A